MAAEVVASVFWSYARTDDEREGGRIVRLASLIQDEFRTLTGAELEMFIDRESIQWGNDFRREIDEALQQTSFFVPVLTSTYFLRAECRREMRNFVSSAESLGLQDLLLSIRYTSITDLDESSTDELKSVAAKMQFESWDQLRLVDENSAAHRQAVNRLANRLVDLTRKLEQQPPTFPCPDATPSRFAESSANPDTNDGDDSDDSPGLLELLADLEPAGANWNETLTGFPPALEEFNGSFNRASEKIGQIGPHGNPFAARLNITRLLAQEIALPVEHLEALSRKYSADLLRLDVIVSGVLRYSFSAKQADAKESAAGIRALIEASRQAMVGIGGAADAARRYEGVSRDLRPLLRRFQTAMRNVIDGQQIIEGWLPLVEQIEQESDVM